MTSPAAGARANTLQLGATFVDSDATDSGTVTFQLCSDAACATVLSSGTSAAVSGGTAVTWTAPGPLADGTYYWRAEVTDIAGNVGAFSTIRSFVRDTNPPAVPVLGSVAAHVSASPQLSASFVTSDAGDSGTILFQICTDSACTSVAASGSSASGLASGANGTWTSSGLAAGSYFWRAAAQDAAGNQSAWSGTGSFAFDTTAPSVPTPNGPAGGSVSTSRRRWRDVRRPERSPGDTGPSRSSCARRAPARRRSSRRRPAC